MTAQVIETDTFPTAITAPTPNDGTYPVTVPQAFSDLASRTKYLKAAIADETSVDTVNENTVFPIPAGTNFGFPLYTKAPILFTALSNLLGRIKTEVDRLTALHNKVPGASSQTWTFVPIIAGNDGDEWLQTTGVSGPPYILQSVQPASDAQIMIPYALPTGARITTVNALCSSPSSHSGSLSGMTMPKLSLYKGQVGGTGTPVVTLIGEATDASPTAANYEQQHYISITGLNHTVASNALNWYYLRLRGESGGNAQIASFRVWMVSITFTI